MSISIDHLQDPGGKNSVDHIAPNNIELNGRRRCLHSASIYTTQGLEWGDLEGIGMVAEL